MGSANGNRLDLRVKSQQARLKNDDYLLRVLELLFVDAVSQLCLEVFVEFVLFLSWYLEEVFGVFLLGDPHSQVVPTAPDLAFNLWVLNNVFKLLLVDGQIIRIH